MPTFTVRRTVTAGVVGAAALTVLALPATAHADIPDSIAGLADTGSSGPAQATQPALPLEPALPALPGDPAEPGMVVIKDRDGNVIVRRLEPGEPVGPGVPAQPLQPGVQLPGGPVVTVPGGHSPADTIVIDPIR
ncbi:hypothetical protein ACFXO9_22815 [Nocardia tengchongensis]|uniref:hypothetical protein n=1 Tax=Nocardia tengchongensis TaxID=2055889 RepID=UPI00369906A3